AAAALHGGYQARTRSFLPTLAVAVVLCVIAAALLSSLGYLLQQLFPAGTFRSLPVNQYRLGFIYYTGILSIWTLIYFGVGAELEAREASMSRMRAETRATRLELEHLQRQIEPHFLFNALNAVVAEIPDRPAIAEEMTRRLADYLRYSLDKRGRGTCRVFEEIEAAETYIRIQALRFDKKLE